MSEKTTQKVYGVVLGNNQINQIDMAIADNLESAIVIVKQKWFQNPQMAQMQGPRLVMSHSIDVPINPFQLMEQPQEQGRDSPITNYEALAMLLKDYLASEAGKELRDMGWKITKEITNNQTT